MIHVCSCFNALPFYTGFEGDDVSAFLTVHLSMKYIENISKKKAIHPYHLQCSHSEVKDHDIS